MNTASVRGMNMTWACSTVVRMPDCRRDWDEVGPVQALVEEEEEEEAAEEEDAGHPLLYGDPIKCCFRVNHYNDDRLQECTRSIWIAGCALGFFLRTSGQLP